MGKKSMQRRVIGRRLGHLHANRQRKQSEKPMDRARKQVWIVFFRGQQETFPERQRDAEENSLRRYQEQEIMQIWLPCLHYTPNRQQPEPDHAGQGHQEFDVRPDPADITAGRQDQDSTDRSADKKTAKTRRYREQKPHRSGPGSEGFLRITSRSENVRRPEI